ncbi:MAG: hypothetical protein IPM59_09345 [Chloracidobacterium sp.]|nr:hypothetical protein [Chloracidobacterium sp.]
MPLTPMNVCLRKLTPISGCQMIYLFSMMTKKVMRFERWSMVAETGGWLPPILQTDTYVPMPSGLLISTMTKEVNDMGY